MRFLKNNKNKMLIRNMKFEYFSEVTIESFYLKQESQTVWNML